MDIIIAGLAFGFFTSFHCAGMCGPIALALPLHGTTKLQKAFGGLLYNLGRTTTYITLGMAFGILGQGLGALGFQRWLSIITGALMILTAVFPSLFKFSLSSSKSKGFSIVGFIKNGLRELFSTRSFGSLFIIGLLNGFLPCGPLYSAIIISTGTGNVLDSVMFMAMFGLGTIPMMFTISITGNFISLSFRRRMNSFIPVVIVIIGILFILRGLNLGIPYLSPTEKKIEKKMKKTQKEYSDTIKINLKNLEGEMDAGKHLSCCGS